MLSTSDFTRTKVNSGSYEYKGFADNRGKWMLKHNTARNERLAKTLANYFGVKAPRVLNVTHQGRGEYHLVEYFDNAVTANEWLSTLYDATVFIHASTIKSALRMVAFDSITLDNDRHSQNVMVRNNEIISIDLENAFERYGYTFLAEWKPRDVDGTITRNDVLCTLFGDGSNAGWVRKNKQLNLHPRDFLSRSSVEAVVNRVRSLNLDEWASRVARLYNDKPATLRERMAEQREVTVRGLADWLL